VIGSVEEATTVRSLAVRTLRLHDQGRRHRRIVHRPTVPHRGNWVGATVVPFAKPRTGTRYRDASHYGVLRITLGAGTWSTEFDCTDGVVADKA
jgi:hypothetical protein